MTERKLIRVVIVDDHFMVRDGLKLFVDLTSDMECVGVASSGKEALEVCRHLQPDVVLMDLLMPGMGGIEATAALHQELPQIHVIALTSFAKLELIQDALRAGATGYLLKNATMTELADAIRSARLGRRALSTEASDALVEAAADPFPLGHDLTEREREVLTLLGEGKTNLEIARQLTISESTVRFHISNIFMKLGCNNRTEAVRLALRHRLIA
jgi:NarL family two-component system response regulator LiaR